MTARDRLASARAALAAAAVAAAVLWGVCAALAVYASLVGVALAGGTWIGGTGAVSISVAAAAAVGAAVAWRSRRVWSASHVALWIEERTPALRYALVTALELPRGGVATERIEARVAATEWQPAIRTATARAIGIPLAAALVAIVLLVALRHFAGR